MIDIVNSTVQAVNAGGGVVFGTPRINTGCTVRHEAGTSRFALLKPGIYQVTFVGNIALPAGGVVGEIDVGISVDGDVIEGTEAAFTPAAVSEYGNVTLTALVRVYGCNGCGANVSVAVVNTSGVAIDVRDANLIIDRKCGGGAA